MIAIGMIAASYYANSYALNSMPFRVREATDFDFDFDFNTLSSSMHVDACNLTAFPATFDRFEATMRTTKETILQACLLTAEL